MGNQMRYLSKPITDCSFEIGSGSHFCYTAASMQGWRKYQEDRFVCIPNFYEDASFFGVYDGHGGSEIAEFLKQRLHLEVLNSLQTQNDIELALHLGFLSCDASIMEPENIAELNDMVEQENRGTALQILKNQKSLEAAMSGEDQDCTAGPSDKSTFSENLSNAGSSAGAAMQEFFQNIAGPSQESKSSKPDSEEVMQIDKPVHYLLLNDIEPSDPEDEDYNIEEDEESSSTESEEETNNITAEEFFSSEPGYLSGSTATVAIIQQNKLYVANVGDSRCVLSRNGQAIDMSLDHKPDDPEEQARIIGAGGSVSEDGRVDNCLNLSRAFGDFKFKGDSFVPSQQCITAEPYIKSLVIDRNDDFLIIASDGIWNSMSSQEVVDYVNIRLKAGDCELKDICEEMFKFTLASDKDNDGTGCDNMCCILIKFGLIHDAYIYRSRFTHRAMTLEDIMDQQGRTIHFDDFSDAGSSGQSMTTYRFSDNTSTSKKCNHAQDAEFVKQSNQHLVHSYWNDFSLQQERNGENLILKLLNFVDGVKRIASEFSQSSLQSSLYFLKQKILNLKESVQTTAFRASVSPLLDNLLSSYENDQDAGRPSKSYISDTDFTNSYQDQIVCLFKNTQLEEVFPGFQISSVVNLTEKVCVPICAEEYYSCNKYPSKVFNSPGHIITIRC